LLAHSQVYASIADLLNFDLDSQKEYADGDIICYKGEPGDTFYLIKEGSVNIKTHGQEVASLQPGDYFGEKSLLSDEPRNADVVAEGYVVCHTLSRQVFQDLLGSRENLWQFECLRKVIRLDIQDT
jgi:CRP-like cAMP-binding protein